MTTISEDIVKGTAVALEQAANADDVVYQVRVELQRRAKEWARAASDLETAGDERIEVMLAGSIVPGMTIVGTMHSPRLKVVRFTQGNGSLHCEREDTPQPYYRNIIDLGSPVAVYVEGFEDA